MDQFDRIWDDQIGEIWKVLKNIEERLSKLERNE